MATWRTCLSGVYASSESWKTTFGKARPPGWSAAARPQNEKTCQLQFAASRKNALALEQKLDFMQSIIDTLRVQLRENGIAPRA